MFVLAAATLTAQIAAVPAASVPEASDCPVLIARAIAQGHYAGVPRECWRMGPLVLGMSKVGVERRLGLPVASTEPRSGHYHVALYAFPSSAPDSTPTRVHLVELRYAAGHLAAIDTAPGARTDSEPCAGHPARIEPSDFTGDEPGGPLLAFNGVSIDDSIDVLRRRFGRAAFANASRDWFSYLPLPVSFSVDPDRRRIVGITIARDTEALTTAAVPLVHLVRDPVSCRVTAVRYGLSNS